ncbi:ABC transporter ATP-binding protein [Bradyrhizobium sp. dw_78]|uniref:ABC transporter ATP-binding protein n=1 Tax=Bradyrhizobium sp. dw_78 TaxID=2719793 RepID=UPI001BD1DE50|nr:ABC transporter ATP-binding protein [Bradyrhizobium sp. dw_78]
MLEVEHLNAGYGLVQVLNDVTLSVPEGAIVTLLGANGAGKTTALNTIAGLMRPWSGQVTFRNRRCDALPAHRIVRQGLSLVAEQRELFLSMTILENLMLGAYTRNDQKEIRESLELVFEIFPRLAERKAQVARTLSGGEQQMLAIGRGLMAKPSLLLLDEPSLGIAPLVVLEIFDQIRKINRLGVSVFVVEQNAKIALEVASYGYVMENGRITVEGAADVLRSNPKIQEAYLGI